MEKIVKTLRYTKLLTMYKDLLSASQYDVLEAYFSYDLSISEIAENKGISRAAVEDALKKGTNRLDELEDTLKLLEKTENCLKITAKMKQKALNCEQINDIESIEGMLK